MKAVSGTGAEQRTSARPTRHQVPTAATLTTASLAAGGLLYRCSDSGPPSEPAAPTSDSPTPRPTQGVSPTPSAPPAGLATLTMPVAYTSIPIRNGNWQPPMVVLMRPSEFYAGSGWGLADERFESDAPRDGHDPQPDYSSNGSHLLITSPSETVRLPRADPADRLDLPADPGEPGAPGTQQIKSAVRSLSGLYLWVRMQGHDVNADAHWTDTAISVGRALSDTADTAGTQQVARVTTLDLPSGNWTYKVRLLMTGYS